MNEQFIRYIGASIVALMGDFGLYLFLVNHGDWPLWATAASSYMVGIVIHWLISSRIVFWQAAQTRGFVRVRQKALFVGSALLGLILTTLIVDAGDRMAVEPFLSKALAVVVSFITTYLVRKFFVFAKDDLILQE